MICFYEKKFFFLNKTRRSSSRMDYVILFRLCYIEIEVHKRRTKIECLFIDQKLSVVYLCDIKVITFYSIQV